jgi:hypothetical protein
MIASHPRSAEVPSYTALRLRWLAWVVCLAYSWGVLFGPGRSDHHLE